jgi:hypothetical protein
MDTYTQLFDICVFFSGVYMMYCAFTRKGSLYNTENIKKGMEENYKIFVWWFCLCGGIVGVATGLLDYFKVEPFAMITFILLCVIFVVFVAVNIWFTDRKSPRNLK